MSDVEKKRGRLRKAEIFGQNENAIIPVEDSEEILDQENNEVGMPTPGDPAWTYYVLSLLKDDEFNTKGKGRYPTVGGIRRVFPTLLGKIVRSESAVVQCPSPENDNRTTVIHYLEYIDHNLDNIKVNGAVDLFKGNALPPF